MSELHAPNTGVGTCFEEEVSSSNPKWHSDLEKVEGERGTEQPKDTPQNKKVEENMILGR